MTDRTHYEDLVAAYALDAVTTEERTDVRRVLGTDPSLQRELDDHLTVAAILAEAVEDHPSTPSSRVWDNIAAGMAGESLPTPPELSGVVKIRKQRMYFRIASAVSIAAVAVAAVLSVAIVGLIGDDDPTQVAISQLLEDPQSEVVTLAGVEGITADAKIVFGDDGIGYVFADTLPPLPDDRTYQLWAIVGEEVISAGVLGSDPDQSPFQVVGDIAGFAITNEVAGGVPVSEGTAVAVWARSA